MIQQRKRTWNRINDLGFESVRSLYKALRVPAEQVTELLKTCKQSYPYDSWTEPKKSGSGSRRIEHPHFELKRVQVRINRLLQRLQIPAFFHGCLSKTSIKTNAEPHCQRAWFLSLDLANYYTTIRPKKVYAGLLALRMAPDVSRIITQLTTIRHLVPQGAPTSPMIATIAMLGMANRIDHLVRSFGGVMTIYGDNVSVSAKRNLSGYGNTICKIIRAESFRVRKSKTVTCSPCDDKPLPGLIVRNERITVGDLDRETIRHMVNQSLRFGRAGISARVCSRFKARLQGVVMHYRWLDAKIMTSIESDFLRIEWPDEYRRRPCATMSCHCDL